MRTSDLLYLKPLRAIFVFISQKQIGQPVSLVLDDVAAIDVFPAVYRFVQVSGSSCEIQR